MRRSQRGEIEIVVKAEQNWWQEEVHLGDEKGEEDSDRRGSLEIRKGGQLFQCKRVMIKQLIGRRLPISTGDQGGGLNTCVSEDLQ